MNSARPIGRLGGSGHKLPGEFPRTMRVLFSYWTLSIAIGAVVLLPFVALAFASVPQLCHTLRISQNIASDNWIRNGNTHNHAR